MPEQTVETVLGPVRADELGIVLPHEHVPLRLGPSEEEDLLEPPGGFAPRLERMAREALRDAMACGARTLVEATPIGCCRSVPMMQRLSRDTGMHIVACTGFYLEDRFPASLQELSIDAMAELFVRELTAGIADTGARPWLIKVSGLPQLRAREARAFQAAALASRETGAAITTHSCRANRAHFDALVAAGADPARIYIGHADFSADPAEDLYVAERGGHLIYTCWGIRQYVDQDALAARVALLARAGYASAVLLSIDYAIGYLASRVELIDYQYGCPERGYAFLFRYALPKLRAAGVAGDDIDRFLIDNPRAMLVRPRGAPAAAAPRPAAIRRGLKAKPLSAETAGDALAVANAFLAGWPYTRPLEAGLLESWAALPGYQPERMLIGYRDGRPRAFLHGEACDGGTWAVHLLAAAPGAAEEAAWLLDRFEAEARAAGAARLVSAHWASGRFYGGHVLGLEPYLPHWAADGVAAYVRAGFRISLPGVILAREMTEEVAVEEFPAGYACRPIYVPDEGAVRPFGYAAYCQGAPVARCAARLYPGLAAPGGGPVAQLGPVATDEPHRGRGLARRLVQACLRDLRQRGASECLIATGLDNAPALRAYARAGFQRRHFIAEWEKVLREK